MSGKRSRLWENYRDASLVHRDAIESIAEQIVEGRT